MKSSLTSSSQPRSVAIADFNNDHQLDIIVANSGTNTVGIFLSKDDATFANQTTYSTGPQSRPYSIAVTDFNSDNYLDIAVANYGTNNIGIFLGNGNATFIEQTVFSVGSSHPLFITIDDFNNDTCMDIAVANYGTNNIGILLGYGNGSFQNQTTCSTDYDSIPCSLAVADFNKDNQLDIVVANYGTNNIGIFLGYGNGTFASQKTYTTGPNSHPSSIALGDFNNDNQLDIVVSNYGTGNIGIFLGHGNGTFLAQTTYPIASNAHPQYITVGHFNKDYELDIVVVDSVNDQIYILPGDGNGNFPTITTYDGISGSNPFYVVVADFNNKNQSDIVVANYGTNNVLLLMNYSIIPSARQTNYFVGTDSRPTSVVVYDFNNDGQLDIVGNNFNDGNILILTGLDNGTFDINATYSTGINSAPRYICFGDLNNDKQMDIVTANYGSDSVGILLRHRNGTFAPVMTYSTGIGSTPWWVALGDVNNDNRLDIVSANTGSNSIGIHLGHGDGTFAAMVTYSTGFESGPQAVAVGDMNNDNYLDLVVADDSGFVFIFLGYGNGSFIVADEAFTGARSYPFSIALAYFNSDNYLDIVVANRGNNNIVIFFGNGDGTLIDQITYLTGTASTPYYVIVADFNNDNIYDIAVTNLGIDDIVIFYGYGNGSFELARKYSTGLGSSPYGITTADFNNDKQLEIIVTLWGNGNIAVLTEYYAASFANQTRYSTGSAPQPSSVAAGDFNNDNRSDIVVANSGTDSLGIFFGWGNGTFGMEMTYSIGTDSYPQYVITCDINKDNQLDIVSVNSKIDSISVIMGYGNGSFAEQIMYSTGNGSNPYAVAAGDLNHDNRLDFVIVNEGTNSIGILFGFNYTCFQSQQTYSSIDNLEPYNIIVSDFNNDNYQDIAAVFAGKDNLGILFGYGNGSFTSMMIYPTGNGSQPHAMAVGDFNNDGRSDIVVANSGTSNIGVLLGYGNGSFVRIMTYSTGESSAPYSVAVGDFNNDDQLDIVVANYNAASVGVLLGYGNGTFSVVKIYSTGQGSTPRSVAVGDFDNDNRLDIVVANYGINSVGILLGYGDGTFGNQVTFSTGYYSAVFWLSVGDFNSDNRLDIATANFKGNNVGILLGYGNGTFADVMTYSTGAGSAPTCVRVGDFNNDNRLDIAVTSSGTKSIVVLFGFGDGSFLLGTAYSTGIESLPYGLAIGNFNNDNRLDIAVANYESNDIGIFLGHGNEPFASITEYTTGDGSEPHSVALGDLNNDGHLDIVVANYGTNNVGVLLGHSNTVFDPMMTYPTGTDSAPYSVAVADFNNDHRLDIVVTNSETDNIAVLHGYGNGTFVTGATYSTGARSLPYTVAIGDFNNDNISDLVIANAGTNNIFLLYGYGNGSFGNETSYPLGYDYDPYSVAVTDLNENGWMDIVIACFNTDHIETLIKMC
jgi:hypothetical protein